MGVAGESQGSFPQKEPPQPGGRSILPGRGRCWTSGLEISTVRFHNLWGEAMPGRRVAEGFANLCGQPEPRAVSVALPQ